MERWTDISSPELLIRRLAAKGGATIADQQHRRARRPPPTSRTETPDPLQSLLATLEALAGTHGWWGSETWSYIPHGPEAGLRVFLWRGRVVLFAQCHRVGERPSRTQQAALKALRETAHVEVYVWTPNDLPRIQERLAQPG